MNEVDFVELSMSFQLAKVYNEQIIMLFKNKILFFD